MTATPTQREVEDAIAAWVRAGAELDDAHVLWSPQDDEADSNQVVLPEGPCIVLRIVDEADLGDDWLTVRKTGADVTFVVEGPRVATLVMRAYNTRKGRQLLSRVVMARHLPDVHDLFRGKFGIGTSTRPRDVDARRSNYFDPFAICEVQLHMAAEVTQPGYLIERVEIAVDAPPVGTLRVPPWNEGVGASTLDDATASGTGTTT